MLRKKPYDYVITLTPSNNITHIKDQENNLEYKLAESTATETLTIVEKTLNNSDTLKDAIIVELLSRVDSETL